MTYRTVWYIIVLYEKQFYIWEYTEKYKMNYPIPTHLKNILSVDKSKTDNSNLNGRIKCDCGCEIFAVLQNENRDCENTENIIEYSEINGFTVAGDGSKVIAVCKNCQKKHLIFDEAAQGYNGFVCGDFKSASDDSLVFLKCLKCNTSYFSMVLDIEIEDKEQFIEECVTVYPDRFSPDDYVDSFDWITITVCCDNCKVKNEFLNLELS